MSLQKSALIYDPQPEFGEKNDSIAKWKIKLEE